MNIREAKEDIKKTITIYLDKDEYGNYTIPFMKQRPVFLIGAPGIGKTAIMKQIASELSLCLVSYSMTHHTRQSAIGLPYITDREYGGEKIRVSEYTMSEILATVYQRMEDSGTREGILFLDEINCVSETLAPSMLQFLQYKVFGNRSLPEGWVIVTAGNPPQFNRSVHDFDVATLDRLKYIKVEENYEIWRKYALENRIHGAILAFLEINRSWFYVIHAGVDGQEYVTARGWEDLSDAIYLYEKKGFQVDLGLISQYLTDREVSSRFAVYYDIYVKYRRDYQVGRILSGEILREGGDSKVLEMAKKAGFDERLALMELILDELNPKFAACLEQREVLDTVVQVLRKAKKAAAEDPGQDNDRHNDRIITILNQGITDLELEMRQKANANNLDAARKRICQAAVARIGEYRRKTNTEYPLGKQFAAIKRSFDNEAKKQAGLVDTVSGQLENAFSFIDAVWQKGQELTWFMTSLTAGSSSVQFISKWGSKSYYENNEQLLILDVHENLKRQLMKEVEL